MEIAQLDASFFINAVGLLVLLLRISLSKPYLFTEGRILRMKQHYVGQCATLTHHGRIIIPKLFTLQAAVDNFVHSSVTEHSPTITA